MYNCNKFLTWRYLWYLLTSRFWICKFRNSYALISFSLWWKWPLTQVPVVFILSNRIVSFWYLISFPKNLAEATCSSFSNAKFIMELCSGKRRRGSVGGLWTQRVTWFQSGWIDSLKHKLSYEGRVENNSNSAEIHKIAGFISFRCAALMFWVIQDHYFIRVY